jgi:ATP-dependent Clp protease ATP-binding subunit ClpA
MFQRFTNDARRIVKDAVEIARELGATNVEAEHLLLAVTRGDSPAAIAMRLHGLDEDALSSALVMETERSLAAVGVTAGALEFSPFVQEPRFATSAKAALAASLRVSLERSGKGIGPGHVTLAVLRAQRGTVARALSIAGVDRTALRDSVAAVT